MSAALHSTASIRRHPIHPMLVPFPIACLVGMLLTDMAYWATANVMWVKFSTWLVSAGVILAVLTAIAGVIDIFSDRIVRTRASLWPYVIGNLVILILAILNMLIHTRDAWTSVVPADLCFHAHRPRHYRHRLVALVDVLSRPRGSCAMTGKRRFANRYAGALLCTLRADAGRMQRRLVRRSKPDRPESKPARADAVPVSADAHGLRRRLEGR